MSSFIEICQFILLEILTRLLHSSFLCGSVDEDGRLLKVHLNNATRDSVLDVPLDQVQPFYRALKAITDIANRPENMVLYKMDPGQHALRRQTFQL